MKVAITSRATTRANLGPDRYHPFLAPLFGVNDAKPLVRSCMSIRHQQAEIQSYECQPTPEFRGRALALTSPPSRCSRPVRHGVLLPLQQKFSSTFKRVAAEVERPPRAKNFHSFDARSKPLTGRPIRPCRQQQVFELTARTAAPSCMAMLRGVSPPVLPSEAPA
jgi:hypothetical protein